MGSIESDKAHNLDIQVALLPTVYYIYNEQHLQVLFTRLYWSRYNIHRNRDTFLLFSL